jgi:hypothetical protein
MATIGNTYYQLLDIYKQSEDNRDIADVIEILSQRNEMMQDAPVFEANQGTTHLSTLRKGLPQPVWWSFYQPVVPTKGTTMQVRDATGTLMDWVEVDAELVDRSKNPAKFRMNYAKGHIEGLMQTCALTVVYGNAASDPTSFTGLAPRYNSKTAGNGGQIVDAGGTGSTNTSVWFVTWGETSVHLIYPEGTTGGLSREDKGKSVKDVQVGAQTGLLDVYREKFMWTVGLAIADWRGVVRIANIDVTTLTNDAATGANLIDLMIDAYYKLDNANQPGGNTVIYTSRTIAAFLHKQAMNKKNMNLTIEQFAGKPVVMFLGHPIRRMDTLLETEARVV